MSAGPFGEEFRERARGVVARYPEPRSALLPLLFLAMAEEGYVSERGLKEVAGLLGVSPAEVLAAASFYTMVKRRPTGRFILSLCTNVGCLLRGAGEVLAAIRDELGVEEGTTAGGEVTLETVECLGACDQAPLVQVNYFTYPRLTPQQARALARDLLRGDPPPRADGRRPMPLKETYLALAGFRDGALTSSRGPSGGVVGR